MIFAPVDYTQIRTILYAILHVEELLNQYSLEWLESILSN